jgi:hypothetical protein
MMKRNMAAMCFALWSFASCTLGQTNPQTPPMDVWNALANPEVDMERSATVQNVEIKRDRVTIVLADGAIQCMKPVNGVVFGATFHGNGRLRLDPPNQVEAQQLLLFSKQSKLDMTFNEATFSFTDSLFDEIASAVKWQAPSNTSDDLYSKRQQERERLGAQHLPRLFKSVLSADRRKTGLFVADLHTKEKDWVEVIYDAMQQEEVIAGRWSTLAGRKHFDVWTEFPVNSGDQRHTYDDPGARQDFSVLKYQLDASVEENTDFNATATLTLQPRTASERVLLFHLDSDLRVDWIKDEEGNNLGFVQPPQKSEGDYVAVTLPTATTNAVQKLQFHYGGRGAVRKSGVDAYHSEASGWFPEIIERDVPREAFRSEFELTFRSPKRFQFFATGRKIRDGAENNKRVTTWVSDVPVSSASFVFGDFLSRVEHLDGVDVQIYVANQPDDLLRSLTQNVRDPLHDRDTRDAATGRSIPAPSLGISPSLANALSQVLPDNLSRSMAVEFGNTVKVFQNYFGPYPYHEFTITDTSVIGQSFPGLLFAGWPNFLDSAQKAAIGLTRLRDAPDFGHVMTAHESSHQWFGQGVSWKGYHDVWLSEGFAEFSGNLYVQQRDGPKEFIELWRREKQSMSRLDKSGHTIESWGPLSLGWRLVSGETDRKAFHDVIIAKGAFVLHMLRMQLYDATNPDPDHRFKEMMREYCKTFANKPASTEDFKTVVERYMTPAMNLAGTHTMNWFFNQYVYGTGIPRYTLKYTLENTPEGKKHLKGTVTRNGVADSWKDDLILYGHSGEGTTRLGVVGATHAVENIDATLPGKIDRISINDLEDSLAEITQ